MIFRKAQRSEAESVLVLYMAEIKHRFAHGMNRIREKQRSQGIFLPERFMCRKIIRN